MKLKLPPKSEVIFPSYKLLPWESDWIKEYTIKATDKFKNSKQLTDRTTDKKYLDTLTGIAGELCFREMLTPEVKGMIKQWASADEVIGSPYDFLFDNGAGEDVKVDIKTTGSHNNYVKTPNACNFFYSKQAFNLKESRNIELCELYIQMFYDLETETGYFIGAVTLGRLRELEKIKSEWNGGYKILKSEMDRTSNWLSHFSCLP